MCFVSVVPHIKIFVLGEEIRGVGTNTYLCKRKPCLRFIHWRNCFYVVCKNVTFAVLPSDSSEVEVFGDALVLLPQPTKNSHKKRYEIYHSSAVFFLLPVFPCSFFYPVYLSISTVQRTEQPLRKAWQPHVCWLSPLQPCRTRMSSQQPSLPPPCSPSPCWWGPSSSLTSTLAGPSPALLPDLTTGPSCHLGLVSAFSPVIHHIETCSPISM